MEASARLRAAIEHFQPLTPEAWVDFFALFSPLSLKKGDYLVRAGERNDTTAFVLSGALRAYYTDDQGNEYNKTFFVENSFALSIASVLQDIPSYLSFDALLPTEMLVGSFRQITRLYEKHRCIESLVRKVLEYEWVVKNEQRELRLVLNDAADRYAFFQEEYPDLENKIPQYHIASHLGVTPIQLSRIRASKR